MKNIITSTLLILISTTIFAQNIIGKWEGVLEVPGGKLKLVFNIETAGQNYKASMDSPDQGAFGIPASEVKFINDSINISVANGAIKYDGKLVNANSFEGTFKQSGYEFPLNLKKSNSTSKKLKRPQEPNEPYPYKSEEVKFYNNAANINLAGTLTIPEEKGEYPAVVLISGSGPQDRDESIMGHKPFLVIADYLTKQGFAVLRYDDRGVAKSEGDFQKANSYDFSTDAESAIEYLRSRKETDKKRIYLIGHSEGGLIAQMIAARDKKISAVVLLAAPGVSGDDILISQQKLLAKQAGIKQELIDSGIKINRDLYNIIKEEKDDEILKNKLSEYLLNAIDKHPESFEMGTMTKETYIKSTVAKLSSTWMKYFIKHNPEEYLEKIKCNVLALNGSKDLQVPADENLEAIKRSVLKGGNNNVSVKKLKGLNHLFQECETGAISEYKEIEQTISPVALKEMTDWLKSLK